MSDVLTFDAVTKRFADTGSGVRNLSFSIAAGSAVALVGANGAGKTTVINLCLSYLAPDEGRVRLFGVDAREAPTTTRMKIAYVPEVARLYRHYSAIECFRFFDGLTGARRSAAIYLETL